MLFFCSVIIAGCRIKLVIRVCTRASCTCTMHELLAVSVCGLLQLGSYCEILHAVVRSGQIKNKAKLSAELD